MRWAGPVGPGSGGCGGVSFPSSPVCLALGWGRGDPSGPGVALPARVSSAGPRRMAEGRPRPAPQAHSVCSTALAPECTFGRLHTMVLPPACVRLLSRNFSKMHCFRISESPAPEPGEGDDGAEGSSPASLGREVLPPESSKCLLAAACPPPPGPPTSCHHLSCAQPRPAPLPSCPALRGLISTSFWRRQADPEGL